MTFVSIEAPLEQPGMEGRSRRPPKQRISLQDATVKVGDRGLAAAMGTPASANQPGLEAFGNSLLQAARRRSEGVGGGQGYHHQIPLPVVGKVAFSESTKA